MKRITTKAELKALATELGVQGDWCEPDEQDVTAQVYGMSFDNAGFWGDTRLNGEIYEELHVVLRKDDHVVAAVNLATLFAWATGPED